MFGSGVGGGGSAVSPDNTRDLSVFGSGMDGDLTVTGTVNLQRDMFYRNLTISGVGASINANGWRIFVSETLDISNAAANAIHNNAGVANQTAPGTAGVTSGGPAGSQGSIGGGGASWNAAAGSTGAGVRAGTGSSYFPQQGGYGGANGAGGASGTGNAGGAQRVQSTVGLIPMTVGRIDLSAVGGGLGRQYGGQGSVGGSSGGGDGTNSSNGGAGPVGGAGCVYVIASNIKRGAGTAAQAISAKGGNAGRFSTPLAVGNIGGYGGAGGSGGGWVYIVYRTLEGTPVADLVCVDGGNGSQGGNGVGLGIGGQGGQGGGCGRITIADITAGIVSEPVSPSLPNTSPAVPATAAGSAGTNGIQGRYTL